MAVNPQREFDLAFEGVEEAPATEEQPVSAPGMEGLPPEFLNAVQALQAQYGNIPLEAEIVPAKAPTETTGPVGGPTPAAEVPPIEGQPPAEDWEQKYKSFQGSANAQLQQAMEREKAYQEEIAKLQALLQQQASPAEGSAEAPPTETLPTDMAGGVPSPIEEDPEVKEFMDTYPEIAKPLTKLLTASIDKAVKNILSEVDAREKSLKEIIDPLKNEIGYLQKEQHLDKILRVHPDAVDIATSGVLDSWIKSQPPEVQSQLNQIVDMGSPEQVISLLDEFKKTQQQATPPPQGQQPVPPETPSAGVPTEVPLQQSQTPQLSPEDAQKLSMIEAVKRKGATQPKTSKAVDFDTAFEEAVRGLTNL